MQLMLGQCKLRVRSAIANSLISSNVCALKIYGRSIGMGRASVLFFISVKQFVISPFVIIFFLAFFSRVQNNKAKFANEIRC